MDYIHLKTGHLYHVTGLAHLCRATFAHMTPADISADLHDAISSGLDLFGHADDARTTRPPREGRLVRA
jgi:hypothetical protein